MLECPVDFSITLDGVTMTTVGLTGTDSSAFGEMTATGSGNDRRIEAALSYEVDYELEIIGTGLGTMDFSIEYTNGDVVTHRSFVGVPITDSTWIFTSGMDYRSDFALYIDENADGVINSGWRAGINETVESDDDEILSMFNPPFDPSEELDELDEDYDHSFPEPKYIYYRNVANELVKADYQKAVDYLFPPTTNRLLVDAIRDKLEEAFIAGRAVYVEDSSGRTVDYLKATQDGHQYKDAYLLSGYQAEQQSATKELVIDAITGQPVERSIIQ